MLLFNIDYIPGKHPDAPAFVGNGGPVQHGGDARPCGCEITGYTADAQ